jgi:hypothetical protein
VTDELEQRLRAADPVPSAVPVDSARSPRARTLMERAMTDTQTTLDRPQAPRSRRWVFAAAAAVAAVVGVGVAVTAGDGGDGAPTTLALTAGADDALASCLAITPDILRDASEVAFAGTVVEIDGAAVTLSVDRSYKGAEVDQVVVTAPPESNVALLGGVTFEDGGHYLISANGGVVGSCGLSDVASPQLEALYEDAFTG